MKVLSPERKQSNKILRQWCADVTGDVLSIGSGGDIDKQGAHYRDYFTKATSYTTSDIDPAMDCDRLLDARKMDAVNDESYDCVFVSGVLEHVDDCHAAVNEIYRVLKPGGVFLVGVPFKQPIHRAPQDFWRFTEWGFRWLLRSFAIDDSAHLGDEAFPYGYWFKAVKA